MEKRQKKMAAALAAVNAYLQQEEAWRPRSLLFGAPAGTVG